MEPGLELFPEELEEHYELVRKLGSGGMGIVALVRVRETGTRAALKLLHPLAGPKAAKRFQREAAALKRLRHRHLLRILDHGETSRGPYLVLEYLEGGDLTEDLGGRDPIEIMLEVASGLQVVHEAGLIHRDLKPANIMLHPERGAVLLDFGLVRDLDATRMTSTGQAIGTPAYLPPELLAGGEAGRASDWYSWGACLYRLLEGREPYTIGQMVAALQRAEPLPELTFSAVHEDSRVAELIRRCLDLDTTRRPAGEAEIHAALRTGPASPVARWPLIALAGLLLVTGLVLFRPAPEPPPPLTRPEPATRISPAPLLETAGQLLAGYTLRVALESDPGEPREVVLERWRRAREAFTRETSAGRERWQDLPELAPDPALFSAVSRLEMTRRLLSRSDPREGPALVDPGWSRWLDRYLRTAPAPPYLLGGYEPGWEEIRHEYRRRLGRGARVWRVLRSLESLLTRIGPRPFFHLSMAIQDGGGEPWPEPTRAHMLARMASELSAPTGSQVKVPSEITGDLQDTEGGDLVLLVNMGDWLRTRVAVLEVVGREETTLAIFDPPRVTPGETRGRNFTALYLRLAASVVPRGARRFRLTCRGLEQLGSSVWTAYTGEIYQLIDGPQPEELR